MVHQKPFDVGLPHALHIYQESYVLVRADTGFTFHATALGEANILKQQNHVARTRCFFLPTCCRSSEKVPILALCTPRWARCWGMACSFGRGVESTAKKHISDVRVSTLKARCWGVQTLPAMMNISVPKAPILPALFLLVTHTTTQTRKEDCPVEDAVLPFTSTCQSRTGDLMRALNRSMLRSQCSRMPTLTQGKRRTTTLFIVRAHGTAGGD